MKAHVLHYLERSAHERPDCCAVIDEHESCTYEQLMVSSMRVGSALAAIGTRGQGVIVVMEKGVPALIAQLGILYAGGFYVPVDPSEPTERLQAIVRTLGCPLIICGDHQARLLASLSRDVGGILCFDALASADVNLDALRAIRDSMLETEPAYVLFTSGSTGTPKGVAVSHRAIVSFIDSFVTTFGITENDRIGNQAPFGFDVSTKDIYASFAAGATLVIIPRRLFMSPTELVAFLGDNHVTVLIWAVAALCIVSSYHAEKSGGLESVRMVMFSGEVMPRRHLDAWRQSLPQATFVNLYGPTEATCNCLYHVLDHHRDYEDGVPLGCPFPHCDVVLADGSGNVVNDVDVEGELLIRGPSLALGYLGQEELTRRSFTQNPTHSLFPDLVYRTGDMAALNSCGELVFRGRRDNQVKHQGHRIELEEVEAALERIQGVDRCRCAYDSDRKRLIAFYEGGEDRREIMRAVREVLPAFMCPGNIRRVDALPVNKNGKVDRNALLHMGKTPNHFEGERHEHR